MRRYGSEHIEVLLDRPRMAECVCECHGVVKGEFGRLLPELRAL